MVTAAKENLHPSIEEQRAQAEALFASIGDGAIATDEYGKIVRMNQTALHILGFAESEVQGQWFPKKILAVSDTGEPLSVIDRPITKAFLTGKPISQKMYYIRGDGDTIPVAVTVSPILLNGRPVGAIEVFRDVTLENEIDRMKSEFISLASHQLRTPLSSIKTYSHMLIDGYMGPVTATQKKSLRTIVTATNRMNELVSTLLSITRIESGAININAKTFTVDKLMEEIIKELTLSAQEKSITLGLNVDKKNPVSLKTDRLLLKEVISNLLSNAIKYSHENSTVELQITSRRGDVLITVIDVGWGIPKYSQDQVFTKFFRASNVIKRETTGTGLGLYLVKGLVENLGGTIWFESEEGKGTTFFVSLPKKLPTVTGSQAKSTHA